MKNEEEEEDEGCTKHFREDQITENITFFRVFVLILYFNTFLS